MQNPPRRYPIEELRPSAKERILAAAAEHFYCHGVRGVGVDTIIAEADVAKATFYRHFASKDDLVQAWLADPRTNWFRRIMDEVRAKGVPPDAVVPAIFDAVRAWLEAERFRGCPYLNTAVEMVDTVHPARRVVERFVLEVRQGLASAVAEMGYADPSAVAAELHALLAGALILGPSLRSNEPVLAAKNAAMRILREARPT